MIPLYEFFRSVETVWVIWLIGSFLLALVVRTFLGQWRKFDLMELIKGEDGASYTVSYVLAFPVFMLLVCCVIQSTIILVVKMGNVYAAYSAARSSVVWLSADMRGGNERLQREERIRHAAVNALTPFGSSSSMHAKWLNSSDGGTSRSQNFYKAYQSYSITGPAPEAYIARKYQCADKGTKVSWEPQYPRENEDVTLTLEYQMPLHIPWFATVLQTEGEFVPITTKVILPFEGARDAESNRRQSGYQMGIPYYSP